MKILLKVSLHYTCISTLKGVQVWGVKDMHNLEALLDCAAHAFLLL